MSEDARLRRRKFDHERYIAHREERLEKQRAYYCAHREQCIAAVAKCYKRKSQIKYLKQYGKSESS